MSKVSNIRQTLNYSAIATKFEVELAPFESTTIVLVVFGCVLPANLTKVD